MNKIKAMALAASSLVALYTYAPSIGAADLTLDIINVKKSSGMLYVAVYQGADTFLTSEGIKARARVKAKEGSVEHVITGLEPGEYAVSIFHDVDGNGKMKMNDFGAPREPVGMSRDARGVMGPPAFEDASFSLGEKGKSLTIPIH